MATSAAMESLQDIMERIKTKLDESQISIVSYSTSGIL